MRENDKRESKENDKKGGVNDKTMYVCGEWESAMSLSLSFLLNIKDDVAIHVICTGTSDNSSNNKKKKNNT